MPGRPPKVDHVREAFLSEIDSAINLIIDIQSLPTKVNPATPVGIHPKHSRQVVELAFMGMVAAWEEFLERSLVRYVAGAVTDSGYVPKHKFGQASSINHAYELLSQDPKYDPARNYLKVTDPRWVWRTADFFFHPHPYSCLQAHADLLNHASSIRNRVAHNSEKCRAEFKASVVYFLRPAGGTLTQGFGPGDLLLESVQRHFPKKSVQKGDSHIQAYADLYEDLARSIVP